MRKKIALVLGVVISMLVLLSGCSGGEFDRFIAWGLGKPYETEETVSPESASENDGLVAVHEPSSSSDYDDVISYETDYGTYECGSGIQTENFRISYLDCELDWADYDELFPPSNGYRVVRAYFRFENIGTVASDCGRIDFTCYADDLACRDFSVCRVDDLEYSLTLSPGRRAEGWAYFEVPEKAERIELEYSGDSCWNYDSHKPIFIIS